MNPKIKLFIKIIYYIAMFTLGAFLAIYLPNSMYYSDTMNTITSSLSDGKYEKAMIYIGGYFNNNDATRYLNLYDEENNRGLILYEAATVNKRDNKNVMDKSYAGFLFNAKDYKAYKKTDPKKDVTNDTVLIVTDLNGNKKNIDILDADINSDGVKDKISTLDDKGFIFLDLSEFRIGENLNSIASLEFRDSNYDVYQKFDLTEKSFDYNSKFFQDVTPFMDEYNTNSSSTNENLKKLDEEFRAISNNYLISNYTAKDTNVAGKSIAIIIIYFVIVYIVGDSLLGKRYLYRGIKKLIFKIFKIKPKDKDDGTKYTQDYYSTVTISLNIEVSDIDKFPNEVNISYNNENEILNFKLNKDNNYTEEARIKAGTYTNFRTDLKGPYKIIGNVSNVIISGFKTNIVLIIKDKEVKQIGQME